MTDAVQPGVKPDAVELAKLVGSTRLLIQKRTRGLERQGSIQFVRRKMSSGVRLFTCCTSNRTQCFAKSNKGKDEILLHRAIQLTDVELVRFLRVSEYDPQRACDLAMDTLQWRRDHGVDLILGSSSEFEPQDETGSLYWCGADKAGRPVLVVRIRKHDPKIFSWETSLRYVVWKLEEKLSDPLVEDITVIIDLKGASLNNVDTGLRELSPAIQKFYPGRLGLALIYPGNIMSQVVGQMFLSSETKKKCVFVNNLSNFREFITKHNLETRYGGLVERKEFSCFMQLQDERLDSLIKDSSKAKGGERPSMDTASQSAADPQESPTSGRRTAGKNTNKEKSKLRVFGKNTMDYVDKEEGMSNLASQNTYSFIDASAFNLRCGPNYYKNKQKQPSGSAIYELVAMDICEQACKNFHVASRLELPVLEKSTKENLSGLPEMLVVSFQAPIYAPSVGFGSSKQDGRNVAMSAVFRLSEWARGASDEVSVKLFRRFVNCFSEDPFRKRLKCIATVVNPKDMSLSRVERGLCSKFNSTPWMVEPQYEFYSGPGYFEIDVDIHSFNYFSKKVGWSVTNRLDVAILDASLVVQAETDAEMPERALCCWRANRLQLNNAPLELELLK